MFKLDAMQISQIVDGRLSGANVNVAGVSIDSRNLQTGNLFVAISGSKFDGHNFIVQAQKAGATAALVSKIVDSDLPQILVADTMAALSKLGAWWRAQFTLPIIAITGSAGKTTTKELTAAILRSFCGENNVLVTSGNLNNHLGVPLTLLQLGDQHKCAVLELGANHIGEIKHTAALVKANIGVITNAGNAHIGEFGGRAQIVQTKAELISELAADGVMVLNKDDESYAYWQQQALAHNKQVISFGINNEADFGASNISQTAQETSFNLLETKKIFQNLKKSPFFTYFCSKIKKPNKNNGFPVVLPQIKLKLLGAHNVSNALAAIAAACALNIPFTVITKSLAQVEAFNGRCKLWQFGDLLLLDDSYNANPEAVKAALNILDSFTQNKVLLLGEIGELGAFTEKSLEDLVSFALTKVSKIVTIGSQAHLIAKFGGAKVQVFSSFSEAAAYLSALSNTIILVKGSRIAGLEQIISLIKQQLNTNKEQKCCSQF